MVTFYIHPPPPNARLQCAHFNSGHSLPTVTTDLRWCRITQSGLLRFDGPDTQSFLQSQLTSNLQTLTASRSQYSGYCTAKGRLLACLLLWRREDAVFMMLPRELCEPLRKRLSMYILRAKVKTADVSAEQVLFGVTGAGAASAVAKIAAIAEIAAIAAAPAAVHDVLHADGVSMLKLPVNRYLIAAPLSAAGGIEAALTTAGAAADRTLWDALDIEAGIPSVVAATQEQFVPQTVNFDCIGAVSFDKGCYPGQEIVARMHYLGKLKQRMVRARLVANDAPAAGDKLYSAAFGDQSSGMIVSAISTASDNHEVLAVVQTSSLAGNNGNADTAADADVHSQSPTGPRLQILPLPYTVK